MVGPRLCREFWDRDLEALAGGAARVSSFEGLGSKAGRITWGLGVELCGRVQVVSETHGIPPTSATYP